MPHPNGDQVLLKTRFGSVDGGTCRLPVPYEGSIWDRLFESVVRLSVTAEISLTSSRIKVAPMFVRRSYEIPLDHVIAVYPCNAIGSRYWGRDSVLKVVWEKDGSCYCSWVMLGPGHRCAAQWERQINGLLDPAFTRQHLDVEEHREATIRLRRRNRRLTRLALVASVLFIVVVTLVIFLLAG